MRIQYFIIICQDKLVSFFNYVTLFQLTSFENCKVLKVKFVRYELSKLFN
jgi:hypothetical protein